MAMLGDTHYREAIVMIRKSEDTLEGSIPAGPAGVRPVAAGVLLQTTAPQKPAHAPADVVGVRLHDGRVTWVDQFTAKKWAQWKWCRRSRAGYVQLSHRGKRRRLHRAVAGAQKGEMVHHRDGDPNNNWRSNLILCSGKENAMVRRKRQNCTSIYVGVHLRRDRGNWRAEMEIEGQKVRLGPFSTAQEAAFARDLAVMLLRPRAFWQLNFLARLQVLIGASSGDADGSEREFLFDEGVCSSYWTTLGSDSRSGCKQGG